MNNVANSHPLTQQLIKLAKIDFIKDEYALLVGVLDAVIDSLADGHSCLVLNNFYKDYYLSLQSKFSLAKLLNLLTKSGLVSTALTNNINFKALSNTVESKPLTLLIVDGITKPNSFNPHKKSQNKYLLYITRYFSYELQISKLINEINNLNTEYSLHDLLNMDYAGLIHQINQFITTIAKKSEDGFPNELQTNAVKTAILNKLSIITGGPGTGKTTTVVLLLLLLFQLYAMAGITLNVHVCAPTGKAAMRVREAVKRSINMFIESKILDKTMPTHTAILNNLEQINYGTIHKLLGYKTNSIYFKHNANNLLTLDILIIDEASMISLPLFYKLLSAINLTKVKHLIFLGDKNQLSAVEEGHVFAPLIDYYNMRYVCSDLISNGERVVTTLTQSKRNQEDIATLSQYVLGGDFNALKLLLEGSKDEILHLQQVELNKILQELFNPNGFVSLHSYIEFIKQYGYVTPNSNYLVEQVFKFYTQLIVLCLTNHGVLGVDNLNLHIENTIKHQLGVGHTTWYVGRPIIILVNDYYLNLYNGDIGICVLKDNALVILFEDGRFFVPAILPKYKVAYAITIHKSQGSEYSNVALILPPLKYTLVNNNEPSGLITRELLYTAITRAKDKLILFAEYDAIKSAVLHNFKRQTGLPYLLKI